MNGSRLRLELSVICLFAIGLGGCARLAQAPQPQSKVTIHDVVVHEVSSAGSYVAPAWDRPKGLGIGFVWPSDRNLPPDQRPQTEEVSLAKGQSFAPYLVLQAATATTVLVTAIVDYQQTEFELDGRRGLLHEVRLQPGGDLELPLRVEVGGEGKHDLLVIAFDDPYNGDLDPRYRSSMSERLVGRRAVVLVGNADRPARILPPAIRGAKVPADVTLNLGAVYVTEPPLVASHPSEPNRQLAVARVSPQQTLRFQVWVSHLDGEAAAVLALLQFLDFHQVDLQGSDVFPVYLQPGEEIVLDASLQLPSEETVHQLQLVYLYDPYESLLHEEVLAPFVFASPRIAVDTRP